MKQLILQNVPVEMLTIIEVNEGNCHLLEWEHKTEFKYNHKMYDVIRSQKKANGVVLYYCISDSKETELIQQFKKITSEKNNQNQTENKTLSSVFHFLLNLFPPPLNDIIFFSNTELTVQTKLSAIYLSFVSDITSPPPQLV